MVNFDTFVKCVFIFLAFFSDLARSVECPVVDNEESYKCNIGTSRVNFVKQPNFYQNALPGSKIGVVEISIDSHCNLNQRLLLSLGFDQLAGQRVIDGKSYLATSIKGVFISIQDKVREQGGVSGRIPFAELLPHATVANEYPLRCIYSSNKINLAVYYFPEDNTPIDAGEHNIAIIGKPVIAMVRWYKTKHEDDREFEFNIGSIQLEVKKTPCSVENQKFDLGVFNANKIMTSKNSEISRDIKIPLSCKSGPARTLEYSFTSRNNMLPGGGIEPDRGGASGVAYKVEHEVAGQGFKNIEMGKNEHIHIHDNELLPTIKLKITPIKVGKIIPGVANIQLILTLTHL
ncbi:hypothetical protein [Aeromonas veronii]|uniref:hypothetical protein n=1 Tax=Aeromonas veronii TaxID=654 RepID=UPI003BA2D498